MTHQWIFPPRPLGSTDVVVPPCRCEKIISFLFAHPKVLIPEAVISRTISAADRTAAAHYRLTITPGLQVLSSTRERDSFGQKFALKRTG